MKAGGKLGACYSFVSTEKIKSMGTFAKKMNHNFRLQNNVPNADPMRTYLNEELIPLEQGSDYIKEYNKKILNSTYYQDHKVRKDAVKGIEVMMTYSAKEIPGDFDIEKWKKENVKWLQNYFGKENVVSAVLHLDETTPHIHAVVIPMVNDRLNAKQFLGGPQKLRELQNSYGEHMHSLGLSRGLQGSLAKHTDIRDFYTAVNNAKAKELPLPEHGETIDDYYLRAQKMFEDSNFQHLKELQEKEREIIELNTGTLEEQLQLNQEKRKIEETARLIEHNFGRNKEEVLSKLKTINNLNSGLKHYPDKEFSEQVFSGMREILRFEKERKSHDTRHQKTEKTLDQILEDAKSIK